MNAPSQKQADDTNMLGSAKAQYVEFEQPLELKSGKVLPGFTLAYETYGRLNRNKSNAILICHALTGDQHAAGVKPDSNGKAGWWDVHIGPGKAIDTDRFYVVCMNNLGGCGGSTGPASINPKNQRRYFIPDLLTQELMWTALVTLFVVPTSSFPFELFIGKDPIL